ncbi:MAG: hypothetical protein KBA51_04810 [Kiritimatiellae bacterium]|nr:hypothetical protein [Kiritimatiellia bacterium]
MNMAMFDWLIVAALLALMTFAAITTRKYNRNVADFLAAGRCARKYVLGVAEGLSCVGAITIVAWFEAFYRGGFSIAWWNIFTLLVQVLVAMSGWVAYRYRQTRALTLAQILEMRYDRSFRIFAGLIIFISGLINFGIFPAVAGRFFQYFWGLQPNLVMIAGFNIDLTYASIMLGLTVVALFFVFAGGQVTIMITDFIQGTFANICLVVIVLFIMFWAMPWEKITQVIGLRDQNPVAAAELQTVPELPAYTAMDALTQKGTPRDDKYILAEPARLELGAETDGVTSAEPNPVHRDIPAPAEFVSRVATTGQMLPGTDYTARFTYTAPEGFFFIVLAPDGRISSACYSLPAAAEPRALTFSFPTTNIGTPSIFFARTASADPAALHIDGSIELVQKPGQSMFNPFASSSTKDFNLWFFVIQALVIFWTYKAWQGTQGYYSAAINAHEARMGGVIGNWRIMCQNMMVLIIPIAAYALLYDFEAPETREMAGEVTAQLAALPNVAMQNQLRTTIVLTQMLPLGLLGAFSAVMLAAFIGTNGTYMHSWGSIFIQDVIMPFRKSKTPLPPHVHFRALRWAIAGVGIFAFFFSLLFEQNDAILMFFAFTGNLWLGGAGAVIVLGLYWKRGTTAGAYAAILTGIVLALLGQFASEFFKVTFPLTRGWFNAQWMMLFSMVLSTVLYIVVSLITGRGRTFDLDRLLHRGRYAAADSTVTARKGQQKRAFSFARLIGMDDDFSRLDRILYTFVTLWSFFWGGLFLLGAVFHYTGLLTLPHWIRFWHFYVLLAAGLGVVTTIWFTVGGLVDLKDLLHRLRTMERHEKDDGSVVEHHLADEP